jgi:hypothetical protein
MSTFHQRVCFQQIRLSPRGRYAVFFSSFLFELEGTFRFGTLRPTKIFVRIEACDLEPYEWKKIEQHDGRRKPDLDGMFDGVGPY